jgi:glycosyltransferase involved in cell wall biosynthesis
MTYILKPKVLLIPAWYPASFFVDQMKLVTDKFNFKVLLGQRHTFGKKSAIRHFLKRSFNYFTNSDKELFLQVDFSYINFSKGNLANWQISYLNNCFDKYLTELYAGGKPDLIHIQSLSDTAVFICNWAEKHNIPVILTEHIIFVRHNFDFFQQLKESVYSRVNKVLCVSNYVYRNLLVNGFRMKKVEIIGNLVNDNFVTEKFEKKEKTNKILFVAAHLADKDIDVLLQAVKILVESNFTDFKIDIFGLDPNKSYNTNFSTNLLLKQEISSLGLSKFFDIKGIMNREDMLKSYKNYSFLVSTSMSETFGLAPAEAILNGLPVVCTDSGGIRDFVNESNGIIVPIRDPQALGEAIVRMFDNVSSYYVDQISTEIINNFGVKAFTQSLSGKYRSAIYDK